jgi:hypothetical protein
VLGFSGSGFAVRVLGFEVLGTKNPEPENWRTREPENPRTPRVQ